jgi:para-nitrobenzyl esterase
VFGPAALQVAHPLAQLDKTSEDCLYLNIFTPSRTGKRPVLVFVHGGAYVFGAGHEPTYDGARLAERGDVVVVTLNYRLSVLGFLCVNELLPKHDTVSNAGLLDVMAALSWVRSQIAAFGGDPEQITLFGESAGGSTVGALLGMPSARGLFARAISQSGALRVTHTERASALAHEFIGHLGLTRTTAERLWELPGSELLRASALLTTAGAWGIRARNVSEFRPSFRFGPIADCDGMPADLFESVAAGANPVPVIAGSNQHEWSFFSQLSPELSWGDDTQAYTQLTAAFGPRTEALIATYRRTPHLLGDSLSDVADAIMGDAAFRMPSLALAQAQAQHSPTFMYLLEQRSTRRKGKLGACHVLDLPLVFRTLDSPTGSYFVGDSAETRLLSDRISDAWIAFARTGSPQHADLPEWPRYDATQRKTLHLGADIRVTQDPLGEQRRAWRELALFDPVTL